MQRANPQPVQHLLVRLHDLHQELLVATSDPELRPSCQRGKLQHDSRVRGQVLDIADGLLVLVCTASLSVFEAEAQVRETYPDTAAVLPLAASVFFPF